MAAHQYWSLLCSPRGSSGVALAEVEMRASAGGADQTGGGTAGGSYTGSDSPAKAFDNDNATAWYYSSGANATRLSYDFGVAVTVAEVYVRVPGAANGHPGATYGPALTIIEWSDDGATWYRAAPLSDLSSLGNDGTVTIGPVTDTPGGRVEDAEVRFNPGWPAGPLAAVREEAVQVSEEAGIYRIAGTVAIDGATPTPLRRRVRLYEDSTGRLLRQTWSDAATGAFEFTGLSSRPCLVMAEDYTGFYDPVLGGLPITPTL